MSENTAKFIDQFRTVFQKAADAATIERERIQAEIATLTEKRTELDKEIHELEKQLDALEDDIAVALKHSAREAGIKLEIGARAAASRGAAQAHGKTAEQERATVLAWLKENKGKHTGGEVKKATKIERNVAVVLKDVKGVKSEGERRSKVYWIQ